MNLNAGISIGNERKASGVATLGCFARLSSNHDVQVMLSCNHVIYAGGPSTSLRIGSPDAGSCRSCCTKNIVAVASDPGFEGKPPGLGTYVDCAIARLSAGVKGVNAISGLAEGAKAPPGGVNPGVFIAGWAPAKDNERVRVAAFDGIIGGIVMTNQPVENTEGEMQNGQLVITVDPGQGKDAVSGSGDSGAIVVNEFNQVVGIMSGRPLKNKNSISEVSMRIIASPIQTVLHVLKIEIESAVPSTSHAGRVLLEVPDRIAVMRSEPEFDAQPLLGLERELRATPTGAALIDAGYRHASEISDLVHHCRRVTLAWHRGHGPSWVAHLLNAARDESYAIPSEIDGVGRLALLELMRDRLAEHGSAALRDDIARHADALLASVAYGDVAEILGRLERRACDDSTGAHP